MFFNRLTIYFTLILTLVFSPKDSEENNTSITITEQSSLIIKGNSNVHSFSCSYSINKIKDPIPIIYTTKANKLSFQNTTLVLDNLSFDCGGKGINNDFQKTLQTEDHPQIVLTLKEIEPTENPLIAEATIAIKIAKLTHNYKIPLEIKRNKNLLVSGQLDVKLSDYNLSAPKKLFGIITVDDTIEILFQLDIQEN